MTKSYQLTVNAGRLDIDPGVAADLEVDWWRHHRAVQHDPSVDPDALIKSLIALYAYVYRADPAAVRPASGTPAIAASCIDCPQLSTDPSRIVSLRGDPVVRVWWSDLTT